MKSFAIIGCGRFGSAVAKTLYDLDNEVLVVDKDPDIIQSISDYVTHAIEADVMEESVLYELGLSNFDIVIVSIGSDLEASATVTLAAKELGVKNVISKAQTDLHGKILKKIGADKVIFPERDMGVRVAHNLASSNILDYIQVSPDFSILEITALKSWQDKTISELKLRNIYGINVIAIKRNSEVIPSPGPDFVIKKFDIVVIIGNKEDIKEIELKAGE
ncbi:MAG TPA: TrkA family potassium uptake protein [Tissierellaceae bacterium]